MQQSRTSLVATTVALCLSALVAREGAASTGVPRGCVEGPADAAGAAQAGLPGEEAEGAPVEPVLIARLLRWIGDAGGYDVAAALADPPRVEFCRTGETVRYEGHDLVVDPRLSAAYDAEARRILLVRPWDAADPFDRSALLHELIHDLQFAAGGWPCPQATEWQAYKLQEAWLAERGLAPGFDWMQIFMLSRCPGDMHP